MNTHGFGITCTTITSNVQMSTYFCPRIVHLGEYDPALTVASCQHAASHYWCECFLTLFLSPKLFLKLKEDIGTDSSFFKSQFLLLIWTSRKHLTSLKYIAHYMAIVEPFVWFLLITQTKCLVSLHLFSLTSASCWPTSCWDKG